MSPISSARPTRVSLESGSKIFLFLLALRVANALTIATFFQPDEYFQSLEPAWNLAFGDENGAWITWEWQNQLRSSLHPVLFAAVYRGASALAESCGLSLAVRSQLLLAAPKAIQALIATCMDYFTWRCAEKIYGAGSRTAWTTLILTAVSPWQAFCSTRTFSNSLETALTAAALNFWPWNFSQNAQGLTRRATDRIPAGASPEESDSKNKLKLYNLRISLCLAALAVVLRPTNILIWIPLALQLLYISPNHARPPLIREPLVCGAGVLAISALSDRCFYGFWTFPPYQFLHFNIAQDLAVFYGKNRLDYYVTEGLPLLLTTSLPFALYGVYTHLKPTSIKIKSRGRTSADPQIIKPLVYTIGFVVLSLSLISHKEVRFLYPLLPALNIIAAEPLSRFAHPRTSLKTTLLAALLFINIIIALYTTQVHQRGVIDVTHFLRRNHEQIRALTGTTAVSSVAFLMPCHSTPWRSHLIHPSIDAWALSCDPPVGLAVSERASYLDEADQFYADPVAWLKRRLTDEPSLDDIRRVWPDKLVFFEQLQAVVGPSLARKGYAECWRGFNSHWHDDSRRTGDVVVWCKQS